MTRERSRAELTEVLDELLQGPGRDLSGGAELEVRDSNGKVVFLAPLARHFRIDEQGIIWVRPIVGGVELDEPGIPYAFDLNQARPRALEAMDVTVATSEAHFQLKSGEIAVIRPASHATRSELVRWDAFYYTALTVSEQAELERLEADSR